MRKIAVLDKHTIDKIAAGEVVERPSSVVKELVENAIDAGATAVTVEISDGGKKLIRITDNGSGLEADQVPLAFLRHATSKIEKVEDLEHIASLGFRGEALSSIAAVSQVELITKTASAMSGVRYVIEGGVEQCLEEMGAPEGTTFLVRNLFYNTPARSKFLKSDMTEGNYISALIEQLALSHPEISFKYIQNRQVKLHTSGNYSTKDVIYSIYGRDITKALLPVEAENDFMKLTGFAGKPEIARGNRNFENYYVNGRFVKNKILTKAIEDAYKEFLMQHKFPFVSLHIDMEGNDLDVNVHPAKREVRFAREAEVYDFVFEAVRRALKQREMIPQVPVTSEKKTASQALMQTYLKPSAVPEPFEVRRREMLREPAPYTANPVGSEARVQTAQSIPVQTAETLPKKPTEQVIKQKPPTAVVSPVPAAKSVADSPERKEAVEQPKQLELFEEELLAPESRSRHILIGQIFDTYWLVEFEDKFYIIDQHAAHEKVYYERFVKEFKNKTIQSQYISPPLIVSLSLEEETTLKANKAYFRDYGFEIEPFGGREYAISAVPSNLYGTPSEDLFLEMLDHLTADNEKDPLSLFTARLATMACKAAVKGNHKMSPLEADKLIDELLTLENPYHCPHGRPTIISMTRTELEKKFKRII